MEVRTALEARDQLLQGIRSWFSDAGFIEVETPILTHRPTGAAARPFTTYHNSAEAELCLRVAPEL